MSTSSVRRPRIFPAALAVAGLFAGGAAQAAITCGLESNGLSFGIYDPTLTTPTTANGNLTVRCVHTGSGPAQRMTFTLQLSPGSSNSYAQRQLVAPPNRRLNYNLYRDLAYTQVVGNGTGGTSIFSGSITVGPGVGNSNRTFVFPVYGRMPARQDALTGSYRDTLILTLTF